MIRFFVLTLAVMFFPFSPVSPAAAATDKEKQACNASDRLCLSQELAALALQVEKDRWRDQIYRELAKAIAADGRAMDAIQYVEKIKSPDTRALTIRGIGVEAAMAESVPDGLFVALREEAEKIEHEDSYAIALTYIAMGQAFAGDDQGATATARGMQNDALRNKAFAETAEIQAEQNKYQEALASISHIDSASFRNKAYKLVSEIFAKQGNYQYAYDMSQNIVNPVMQAEALQFLMDEQRRHKIEDKDQ